MSALLYVIVIVTMRAATGLRLVRQLLYGSLRGATKKIIKRKIGIDFLVSSFDVASILSVIVTAVACWASWEGSYARSGRLFNSVVSWHLGASPPAVSLCRSVDRASCCLTIWLYIRLSFHQQLQNSGFPIWKISAKIGIGWRAGFVTRIWLDVGGGTWPPTILFNHTDTTH